MGDEERGAGSTEKKAQTAPPGSGKKADDEERQEMRGEQGTSSGDPHDDTDPQSG